MSSAKKSSLLALSLSLLASSFAQAKEAGIKKEESPFKWEFSGMFKPGDTYYGKNISLLNNCEPEDRIFYSKHTLDLNADFAYTDIAQARFSVRNKAVWGNSEVAPTTTSSTKILDAVGQRHKHFIPRQILWMREAWLEFSLNEVFGISSLDKEHTFTLGAFSFQLGRGIALGAAYAVSPSYLGFYSDSAIDQYALGMKFSGELIDKRLSYDLYGAFLDNQSNSLSRTGENIFGQQYGRINCPKRGFGNINYVIAARLNITAIDDEDHGKLTFEPYVMFNGDPEQNIEFLADANSRLGTIGLANEYVSERFEFGFDTALNFGRQKAKGWDRNVIALQNKNGIAQLVNSHVYVNSAPTTSNPSSAYKAPLVKTAIPVTNNAGTVAQNFIDGRAVEDEGQNGKSIGVATGLGLISVIPDVPAGDTAQDDELFNAVDRFRNPYENRYKGWMLVTDAAAFCCNHDVRIAATAAYVSGDQDPNSVLKDGDYRGFIGLQELYAGKRVKSAFFLGSAGKLRRPLDIPTTETQPNRFGALASGFSNLALVGAGVTWEPSDWEKSFSINPNMIAFWETYPDRAFDYVTGETLSCQARSFLGVEFNLFMKKELFTNMQLFATLSLFIPGSYFDDVKGKPMDAAQRRILDRIDRTGYDNEGVPGLGTDRSYTFNFGFEYKF
ncbi:hypothetical protein ACFLX2_01045 [Candidatus Dependentiae bacterium]